MHLLGKTDFLGKATLIYLLAVFLIGDWIKRLADAALANGFLSQGKVDLIWYAATVKWFLSGLITAILSIIFWRKWWRIFTPAFLIAAGICFAALYNHALFEKFFTAQFFVLIAVGLLFIILPGKFTRD